MDVLDDPRRNHVMLRREIIVSLLGWIGLYHHLGDEPRIFRLHRSIAFCTWYKLST